MRHAAKGKIVSLENLVLQSDKGTQELLD